MGRVEDLLSMAPAKSERSMIRLLYGVVVAQFALIALLWAVLSNEYLSNVNMRLWIAGNAPIVGLLFNGGVGSVLVGLSAGWTTVYLGRMVLAKKHITAHDIGLASIARAIEKLDGEVAPDPSAQRKPKEEPEPWT